jgi:hypothetical protein
MNYFLHGNKCITLLGRPSTPRRHIVKPDGPENHFRQTKSPFIPSIKGVGRILKATLLTFYYSHNNLVKLIQIAFELRGTPAESIPRGRGTRKTFKEIMR